MEQDKKYNITMGLMVFCFVVIVAIALGLGLGYIKIGSNDDNVDTNVGNAGQVENKEDKQEDKTNLEDVYKKYDFNWISKQRSSIVYVQNGKINIQLGTKSYELSFDYGTPVLVCDVPGQDFSGIVVLNNRGEVYRSNEAEYDANGNLKISAFAFTKLNLNEEIVDISRNGGDSAVPYSGPYYMTKSGKVINSENKTYEEINKDHINYFGGLDYRIFVCEDKTIEAERTSGNYVKIVDSNGNNIKVKYIFAPNNSNGYKIIDENDKYYTLLFNSNGVAYYEEKKVKEFSYDNTKHIVKVTFMDGKSENYQDVYASYDAVNNKDM